MKVLGITAQSRDSAAVLVEDGRIIAAAQEERFSRHKHDAGFPTQAVAYCLSQASGPVDAVATYGSTVPVDVCHAAAAFFPSPFTDAAILVMAGMGGGTVRGMGSGNQINLDGEWNFGQSLGTLYSAITHYTGFKIQSGEYKVMGLAPYGIPRFAGRLLDKVMAVAADGRFQLNPVFFDTNGLPNDDFAALFGQAARQPDSEALTQFHMDMAASVQAVTDQVWLGLARSIRAQTGARHLCLAGEMALNCVANGKLQQAGIFDSLWVQPAAGDAGGALGAALAVTHLQHGLPRAVNGSDAMQGGLLGPAYDQSDVEARLSALGANYTVLSDDALMDATAQALAEGNAVGWVQGRMEFGPRALGNRSILADPRSPSMQKLLNLKVKYRESFRPFAPSVLRDDVAQWFQLNADSPYMLLVAPVAEPRRLMPDDGALFGIDKLTVARSTIPAVTHVDYSARIQTVHAQTNPRYHALIAAFKAKTGCPIVVNTSFNVRGEPIVCTPEDAFRCFMGSEIDMLVVGNCTLRKQDQAPALLRPTKNDFQPD